MHTIKPLDKNALVRAALETGGLVTAEEHQIGGLGNLVAGALATEPSLYDKPLRLAMVGVVDRFGESGQPWQLIRHFGVAAEHIAVKAKELL